MILEGRGLVLAVGAWHTVGPPGVKREHSDAPGSKQPGPPGKGRMEWISSISHRLCGAGLSPRVALCNLNVVCPQALGGWTLSNSRHPPIFGVVAPGSSLPVT